MYLFSEDESDSSPSDCFFDDDYAIGEQKYSAFCTSNESDKAFHLRPTSCDKATCSTTSYVVVSAADHSSIESTEGSCRAGIYPQYIVGHEPLRASAPAALPFCSATLGLGLGL